MTAPGHLHVVGDAEARLIEARMHALALFTAQYRAGESQRTMLGALDRIALSLSDSICDRTTFPWELLIDEALADEAWQAVARRYQPATAQRDAAALRSMLKCCRRAGLLTSQEYQDAKGFSARGMKSQTQPGRTLTPEEMAALVGNHDPGRHPTLQARDTALILTLASTGARRNEIACTRMEDLDHDTKSIHLSVTKNGCPRKAWLHESAIAGIDGWLKLRGDSPGWLFVPLSRTCRPLTERHISPHQIWHIVTDRAVASGIGHCTPHDLRRYLASTLLDQGTDIALVARILGHQNPATTAGYDRRPDSRCRDAISRIPLPVPAQQPGPASDTSITTARQRN